jgi:hypothetical protein
VTYDNTNTTILFKNENKRDEKDSDYNGTQYDEKGVAWWANAWVNTSSSGKKFLKIKRGKMKEQQPQQVNTMPIVPRRELDDEIPF